MRIARTERNISLLTRGQSARNRYSLPGWFMVDLREKRDQRPAGRDADSGNGFETRSARTNQGGDMAKAVSCQTGEEIESRQDEVLRLLDELNDRLVATLRELGIETGVQPTVQTIEPSPLSRAA